MPAYSTGHAVATQHLRRQRVRSAVVTIVVMLSVAGCGRHSPTAPSNHPPVLANVQVGFSSTTYLRAKVTASISDPDGDLSHAVISWGDRDDQQFNSGLDNFAPSHDYATTANYMVIVIADDSAGNQTRDTTVAEFYDPPSDCWDVAVLTVCGTVQKDYQGIDIVTTLAGLQVEKFSLTKSNSSANFYIPVGGLVGQVKLTASASFSTTVGNSSLSLNVSGCAVFLVCTSQLGVKKATW